MRDAAGNIIGNQQVSLQFSVHETTITGTTVYQETHLATTTDLGLVNLAIGEGTATVGTFSTIDWGTSSHYLQVELDPAGGSSYADLGTTQLMSVPYALHAKTAESLTVSSASPWSISGNNMSNNNSGNIGIGTTSPQTKLHVAGQNSLLLSATNTSTAGLEITTMGTTGSGTRMFFREDNGGNTYGFSVGYNGGNVGNEILNWPSNSFNISGHSSNTTGTVFLSIPRNSGYVGIGTTNPSCQLDVVGISAISYLANSKSWDANGTTINNDPSANSTDITIRASSGIMASLFVANSDARIKNVVGLSNQASDLALINQLKVTDYTYIDQVENGNRLAKGFIAQEIAEIIPEAVTKSVKFIPSVYALANNIEVAENGNVQISLEKPHNLKVGDKVKLMTGEKADEFIVASASQYSFEVKGLDPNSESLFVYGKEVDDFHAVDDDRIFTTGIGAIQELSKQVEELKSENASLKTEFKAELDVIKEHLGIDFQAQK